MAKHFSLTGEKSVLSKLLGRDMQKKASSDKTLAENREQLSLEAKAITEKTPLDPRAYKTLESGPVRHTPDYSTTNKDQIVKSAGRELSDFISDKVGRGGFTLDEVEFKKLDSRPSFSGQHSEVINKAVVAFKVNFTTATKEKSCFAAVKYEDTGKKGEETFQIESYFVDCVDNKKVQASRQTLESYLSNSPSNVNFDRSLVYFDVSNPENQHWRKLDVKSVIKSKARLEAAGFEIQARVLGRENNITGPVFELVVQPEKYAEARKVLASDWVKVDTSIKADEKFEESKGNEPGTNTDDPKNWQDRSLEKSAPSYMKPTDASQPKVNEPTKDTPATTWDTRSLEKNESTPLGKFDPRDPNQVKQDEKFEKSHGNTPTESDPSQWQDRSLEQGKAPPGAKTLLKYERKKAQVMPIEQVETSPESILTPPPEAPREIPIEGAPLEQVAPITPIDQGMGPTIEEPKTAADEIIEMIGGLSFEEIGKVEKALEEKEVELAEQEGKGDEIKETNKEEEKIEEKEKKVMEEPKKEEKSEEKKEEKEAEMVKETKEEKKEDKEASKKVASKIEVKASTKKLANFVCSCGSYLSTPVCDCATPKLTALGQVTNPSTGNSAQPNPKFPGNSSKDEMDGLDHGKTAADGNKAKVVPSNEVKSQANSGAKPQSGANPAVPNEKEISTKQEPMGGMTHGKSTDTGTAFEPPHGAGKGAWDGLNEANMIDMNALHKDKSPMDGMDHGKSNDGAAEVVPSKMVPSLKAVLTPGDKSQKRVFRVSAAKKLEALKSEVINQWDRGLINLDQANLKIAALERQAQAQLGQEEVKPEANKYFLDQNMGKDFKEYEDKNWFNRSREKNPDPLQKPLNISQPTENEPTKDGSVTQWENRSLEKANVNSPAPLDIPKTSSEVKPRQDEAFEKANGNEPTKDDVTQWQDRSLEKRTTSPNEDKMMFTE